MYEWSKKVIKKISDAKCLDGEELRQVELALRSIEVQYDIINEVNGLSETNHYELEYRLP